jgi:hypothetical protein
MPYNFFAQWRKGLICKFGRVYNERYYFKEQINMADVVSTQKEKLEQKKVRLLQQEASLKIKERKNRTRHLIEVGGLAAKAEIDHLPTNVLYGAFLSLKETYTKDDAHIEVWKKVGDKAFKTELKTKTPIILKLAEKPEPEIRGKIREYNLKWNVIRQEWYGMVEDLAGLKKVLGNLKYELEMLALK